MKQVTDPYFVAGNQEKLADLVADLGNIRCRKGEPLPVEAKDALYRAQTLLETLLAAEKPNFFRIGYYSMENPNEDLTTCSVTELNAMTLNYLQSHFMDAFIAAQSKGVEYSFRTSLEKKKAVMEKLSQAKIFFAGDFTKAEAVK